jgi:hypothetical protein
MPVTELVEDLSVYPRRNVNDINVANLVAALEAGAELPPIIADRKTKRIVDGFHRRRAYLRVLGTDTSTAVELRSYRNEAELLADAAHLNTAHGLNLAAFEKRKVVLRLTELGVDDDGIARALHMPPARVIKLRVKVVSVVDEGGAAIRLEPLKRPHFHFQGGEMTAQQARAAQSAPGTSYSLLVRQIGDALDNRLVNASDGRMIAALRLLQIQLRNYLGSD